MKSMVEAVNKDSSRVIELDLMEKIKKVTQDGYEIKSEYNKLGQQTLLKSSIGVYIKQDYNVIGKISTIDTGTTDFEENLKYVPDSDKHGIIQPTKEMSMEEFQDELKKTENKWSKTC